MLINQYCPLFHWRAQDHEKVISDLELKVKSAEKTTSQLREQLQQVQQQREQFKVRVLACLWVTVAST